MGLVETLKAIAGSNRIPESEIIWDEVRWFNEAHKDHGPYELVIRTDDDEDIWTIEATCMAMNVNEDQCPHYNTGYSELSYSSFYSSGPGEETQKQRREGTLKKE